MPPHDPNTHDPGTHDSLSRRTFLKGTSAVAAATTLPVAGATAPEARAAEVPSVGPGKTTMTFHVDGRERTAVLEPRTTLLDALRDVLDVTGCKKVCDRSTCGACTVLLEGEPIYACTLLAIDARGKKIETAEGLMEDGQLSRVQQAFGEFDASQCGFCTPGFVVSCSAVLRKNPQATAEQVRHGISGNLCRCGTYEQMAEAVHAVTGSQRES